MQPTKDTIRGEQGGYAVVSLTLEQVAQFKQEALGERPYLDRVSLPLAHRLRALYASREDALSFIQEIDFMEGLFPLSSAVAATQFTHAPLFPFWHKHVSTARHVLHNIILRWGTKELDRLIKEVARECGDDPDKWPSLLVDRQTHGGYQERARKGEAARVRECPPGEKRERGLTGDWIIYGKHEGLNYYLDLATHKEGEQPEQLYEKLRAGCAAEFPFLFP